MQLHLDANLKPYHTFAIDQSCRSLAVIESVQDLIFIYQSEQWQHTPKLMLGKGSNILFTAPYQGLVMVNQLSGIDHSQDAEFHYLHVHGGEDWPQLVAWCMEQGLYGLENLALIPGCAGSAPIQNIGAYGVEFKDVCDYVDYLCLDTLTVQRLTAEQCQFGYRDSIFKHALYDKAIVVAVGLKLAKNWQPVSSYGPLKALAQPCGAEAIYQCVCQTRLDKLPDPHEVGNAGSFFKNPVISQAQYHQLLAEFPHMVAYPAGDGMKIAAGWLIDSAGLKGTRVGGAQVHSKQALVLINADNATARDVIELAALVRQRVQDKYAITLEHEVRFIGVQGETNLTEILEQA
ncbi:UDP-N-acetylmuramate dehydrogenase [Vibrio ostreae]|uniref:UDP-N-acetylenolpyruvoylglucosamine reductase n=1 Tax=Vibrio ostreae TaxID=2841925 RepID=A0A975U8J9_9VIBR|nr:UDP-N-acetylmuramate dehydrogenase [Vibrio ostreae]QXO17188.1 UDP-N-acetylmuramate dehydrogenase [Vibrio ostreae]